MKTYTPEDSQEKDKKLAARLSGNNLAALPYIAVLTHKNSIAKCTAEVNEKCLFFKGFPHLLWLDKSINARVGNYAVHNRSSKGWEYCRGIEVL